MRNKNTMKALSNNSKQITGLRTMILKNNNTILPIRTMIGSNSQELNSKNRTSKSIVVQAEEEVEIEITITKIDNTKIISTNLLEKKAMIKAEEEVEVEAMIIEEEQLRHSQRKIMIPLLNV